jgi:hypothetical protein
MCLNINLIVDVMKEFYKRLGLGEYASVSEIATQYNKLAAQYPPDKRDSDPEYQLLNQAAKSLVGSKTAKVQLDTLIDLSEKMSSFENMYLWYDSDLGDDTVRNSKGIVVFDLSFYAGGEVIKFCNKLVFVFNHYKPYLDAFPQSILPCLNKALEMMQTVFQFDHYDPQTTISGENYLNLLQAIQNFYATVRPELLLLNKDLFNNNPAKQNQDTELRPSLITAKIKELNIFIRATLEIYRNKATLKQEADPIKLKSDPTPSDLSSRSIKRDTQQDSGIAQTSDDTSKIAAEPPITGKRKTRSPSPENEAKRHRFFYALKPDSCRLERPSALSPP